jgi:hypothetical protein
MEGLIPDEAREDNERDVNPEPSNLYNQHSQTSDTRIREPAKEAETLGNRESQH